MIRRFDADLLTLLRLTGNRAVRDLDARHPADPLHRAEKVQQRGEIVRPHVEHRSAAFFIIKLRIRVPMLVPAAHHERGERDRLADQPVIDRLAGRLNARAHECVRRAPDAKVFFLRRRRES